MKTQRIFLPAIAGWWGPPSSDNCRSGNVELVLRTRDQLNLLDASAVQALPLNVLTRFIWRRQSRGDCGKQYLSC
jgi:hypothetical protein